MITWLNVESISSFVKSSWFFKRCFAAISLRWSEGGELDGKLFESISFLKEVLSIDVLKISVKVRN